MRIKSVITECNAIRLNTERWLLHTRDLGIIHLCIYWSNEAKQNKLELSSD